MDLFRALRVAPSSSIAFAGAGGKTTGIFQLAREIHRNVSQAIIVTATSHLGTWQTHLADQHIIAHTPSDVRNTELRGITLITGDIEGDRTQPISTDALSWLHASHKSISTPLLIEADGSRQKPLKAPKENEPPIPKWIDVVVYVAGLSALGKPLDEEFVHRTEVFAKLSGLKIGEIITPLALIRVLSNSEGGLKNIPSQAKRILLLNQAETPELQSIAQNMSRPLLAGFDSVIIANLKESVIHAVQEPIAGIILAAGESKRFGQVKQLLQWRGESFVHAVAKTAIESGLSPVTVVTGSDADAVARAVAGLDVQIVKNENWQSGQSSSVRTGLQALPQRTGAAIFLLADQPQIPVAVIRGLMEAHAKGLYPIVAPLVLQERRANPVLFDRDTFPDLMKLEGDVGGRAIFDKHRVEYLPWHDDSLLFDVDKPEDYPRMKELE